MMRDEETEQSKRSIAIFAVLHLLCCGIPLLLLSGVSLAFLAPSWPVAGAVLAILGVVGFVWYLKRGCATCPRNEGRCGLGSACSTDRTEQEKHSQNR
jgi:hypothetical protein